MNLFKTVVVCVAVVAICGCDRSQPKPPVATSPTPPATTNNPTPVELPESSNSIGMEFKLIPAGKFTMGQGDESHEVTLTEPFQMGVHEVTQAQYEQVVGVNPSRFTGANNPVETVSWEDALEFCRRLSELPAEKAAGNVYRLPTEAEWEYACRAGTTTTFSFGDDERDLAEHGWYHANSDSKTHPVGAKQPNAWGLYDLNGNVWEWCSDLIDKDYMYDPPKLRDPILNVCRGGAWHGYAHNCRPTSLTLVTPGFSKDFVGFRVVREPSTPIPTPVATNVEDIELPESANSIGMKFKLIPAGTFTMGENDDAHEVTLTKPFKMGVHEVTQAQYEQVMGVNPSKFKGAENPVEMMSWDDAVEFCRKLSELPAEKADGNVYRLPTGAQWEYACRAGTTTKFSFGNDDSELGDYAWYSENSETTTHAVGGKQPNAWGLYDMHGNVWEWCQDWDGDYLGGAVTDPDGPASGSSRVIRGGSWVNATEGFRSASGNCDEPSLRYNYYGFRVVLISSGDSE